MATTPPTEDAVWSDALMPLDLLWEPEAGGYMALIDRSDASISECTGSGSVSASFGSITLDGASETATLEGKNGSCQISVQPGTDVHALVLDKQSGDVLYERALKL